MLIWPHSPISSGFALPDELRCWLYMCNVPRLNSYELYGVSSEYANLDIGERMKDHPDWSGHGWIPVAGDGFGNVYVLDTTFSTSTGHPIYFLDHELAYQEPQYVISSNLWSFLRILLKRENGEQYRLTMDSIMVDDPAVLECISVPKPWDS